MKETLTIKISSSMEGVNDSEITLNLENGMMIEIDVKSDSTVLNSRSGAADLIQLFIDAIT